MRRAIFRVGVGEGEWPILRPIALTVVEPRPDESGKTPARIGVDRKAGQTLAVIGLAVGSGVCDRVPLTLWSAAGVCVGVGVGVCVGVCVWVGVCVRARACMHVCV